MRKFRNYKVSVFAVALLLISVGCCLYSCKGREKVRVIDRVPAGFPVNFALFTKGERQYVAYYDTAHVMTVASRKLGSERWKYKKLDSKVGWDSHNYLSLFVDEGGYIHLCGNMHSSPLNYFKSSAPWDIGSIVRMDSMVWNEQVTTYPEFMTGPGGEVLFHYRYGRSGNGFEVYNVLDVENQCWKRLLDKPLINGEGLMNAYMQGPIAGPDGYYHLIWVWRNTPDCSSNHTLSYARSRDMLHWESIRGETVTLPVTYSDTVLVVDPTPEKGGLINIGIQLGFDARKRPVIGYHKYDASGKTQLFLARYEEDGWKKVQQTVWDYRWDFKGWGTIVNELLIDAPYALPNGELCFGYHRMDKGDGQVIADGKTLRPLREEVYARTYPQEMDRVTSDFPGMLVYKVKDKGGAWDGKQYMLRWEALPPNRDQKPEGMLPPSSVLELWEW